MLEQELGLPELVLPELVLVLELELPELVLVLLVLVQVLPEVLQTFRWKVKWRVADGAPSRLTGGRPINQITAAFLL